MWKEYMGRRRAGLARLSLLRWWLVEYAGRGLMGVGLGCLLSGYFANRLADQVGWGLVWSGLLLFFVAGKSKWGR